MSGFKYFRNKRTGRIMRALALPYMGQNSDFEEVNEEEFRAGKTLSKSAIKSAEKKTEKREAAEQKAAAAVAEKKAAEQALPDNDDLTAGLDDGEDGR